MDANSDTQYLKALGARVLSEANDLKRTPGALAEEIGINVEKIDAVIEGRAGVDAAEDVIRAMARAYPVSIADLWFESDDTDHGVLVMSADDSRRSSRIFERKERSGGLAPYYEYRDTAMSRTAPFKPEWIQPIRVADDADPDNPDVAYNNGHLMHQCTFFIGAVNFYWRAGGRSHAAQMNTGDSNYITPFVPHSFTSRDADAPGRIIAVTYGGPLRYAIDQFNRLGTDAVEALAGEPNGPGGAFRARIGRYLSSESMTADDLVARLAANGIAETRAREILSGAAAPMAQELAMIADALHVRLEDVTITPPTDAEPVSLAFAADGGERPYPNGNDPAYRIRALARNARQPGLKGFEVTVLPGAGPAPARFRHGLHEYIYNFGDEPVDLHWNESRSSTLAPGDSAYLRPMVAHGFSVSAAATGRLAVIRVPGTLTDAVIDEYAAFDPDGRDRVMGESMQWF